MLFFAAPKRSVKKYARHGMAFGCHTVTGIILSYRQVCQKRQKLGTARLHLDLLFCLRRNFASRHKKQLFENRSWVLAQIPLTGVA
ncbi:MAG: hypothetical protein B5M56_07490 [Desulfococcus sp. 4484_241]|nr:MAG: hypothetical protein B5M56_07490 [Desulfococcus sp. 4484_241]